MLTLYGNLDSGNVYKVRLLLAQLDIAHRRIDVAQVRGEPTSREFRAINPIGKVPAIRFEDGRVLSESGAILYMLARGTAFFPDDPWPAAQVLRTHRQPCRDVLRVGHPVRQRLPEQPAYLSGGGAAVVQAGVSASPGARRGKAWSPASSWSTGRSRTARSKTRAVLGARNVHGAP